MSFSIQTNVNSLVAQQNLSVTSAFQGKTISQLTSGYRINQAGDDAAGLAVANKFRSSVAELTQGVANGNDAVAQLQIMDGGMTNIGQILDRLKTLATQSASGTFTGDRTTLNAEFQNDVLEIDRQSQSIGLNIGGTFAKSLSVFLGQGTGSASLANAQVTVDLSNATVDAQSLGMKGLQAVSGTADLGASSLTSVSKILANVANKASESLAGYTGIQFSGPGFAGGSVAISVNLNGISDIKGLVANINAAIQSTASGAAPEDAAFKKAGIVASIHTDASGGQQLAFTSSTTAFQVQAGDQMSNALMGNFSSGAAGASLNTFVKGQSVVAGAGAQDLNTDQVINVEVSDGKNTKTYTLTQGAAAGQDTTVADAVKDLIDQVNLDKGTTKIGATQDTLTKQIVFTNSANTTFSVKAVGDASNWLGLGAFLGSAVNYASIAAAGAYDNTAAVAAADLSMGAKSPETTLEFSITAADGTPGASVALAPIKLDEGNAAAASNTSGMIGAAGFVVKQDGTNNTLTFSVDNHLVTTTLGATALDGAAQAVGGAANGTTVDGESFLVTYGSFAKVVTLNGDTTYPGMKTSLQSALNAAFGDGEIRVGDNSLISPTGFTLTTKTGGLDQSITLGENSGTTLAKLGFSAAKVTGTGYTASDLKTKIEDAITGA